MTIPLSFGAWLAQRRRTLDLTQAEFAQRANCALGTLRKWELDERRPSKELAQRLAVLLDLPPGLHATFVKVARAKLPVDRLHLLDRDMAAGRGVRLYPVQEVAPDEPVPGEPPFKGLRAYDVADADLFFGREVLTAKLVGHVREGRRLIILVGASGSGKSSLVRAGLSAAFTRGQRLAAGTLLPVDSKHWQVHLITPGAHPLAALALTLTRDAPSLSTAAALIDDLARDSRSLHLAAVRLLRTMSDTDPGPGQRGLLLVVDQFEELFTRCRDAAERAAFIDNLLVAAAPESDGPITVVITLRADFYAHCAPFAALRDALARWQDYIGPMKPVELRRAIEEPARRGGWEFEPGLVDLLLRDAGQEPGALPLLSHVLLETWQRRRGRRLTFTGYAEAGGLHGAIAETAERIYQQAPPAIQTILRRTFLQLTELGEGTQDTRRRATLRDLIVRPQEAATVEAVLQQLAAARLIMLADGTAEVAHEALIREWPTLREWLVEDREALRLQRRLSAAAAEWAHAGHDRSFLAAGARLAQFEVLATDAPATLSADEHAYLQASLAERDRQASEARERAVTLAANLRHAEALRLAAEANTLLRTQGNTEVIALLSIRSVRTQYTPQGNAVLTRAASLAYPEQRFNGHSGAIWAVAYAPNARSILIGSEDSAAHLWDVSTGKQLRTFAGHTAPLEDVAFSPDGRYILTGSFDTTARLWDAHTRACLRILAGHAASVSSVAFAPNGGYALTGSYDTTVRLWDLHTGACLRIFTGHPGQIEALAYAPDGCSMLTGCYDPIARLWDIRTGELLHEFAGHRDAVQAVAYAPDGATVVTGSSDCTARLWDARTGTELQVLAGHTDIINGIAYAPGGQRVITGSQDNTARIWDTTDGRECGCLAAHTGFVWSVAWAPDGGSVLTGSFDGTAALWKRDAGAHPWQPAGPANAVLSIASAPDGTSILTGGTDRIARLWNATTGQQIRQFIGHTGHICGVAFSPDGLYALTGSGDKTARLWEVQTGRELRCFTGHTEWLNHGVAFAPDGCSILTSSYDRTARIWDVRTGVERMRLQGHTGPVFSVAYAPDGLKIVTGGADGTARLWDPQTGAVLRVFEIPSGAASVAYAPDGRSLLTGSWDSQARLWNPETGALLQRFVGHTDVVWGVAYTPDGRAVVTGSADKTARVWDSTTGVELRRFADDITIRPLAVSPDGRSVVTASKAGRPQHWSIDYEATIADLCGRLLRDLSADEQAQYSIDDTPTGIVNLSTKSSMDTRFNND